MSPHENGLEAALERTEAEADSALRAAASVVRELKKAKTSARGGTLKELQRSLDASEELAGTLVDSVRSLRSGWRFDEREHLESGAYLRELVEVARARGLSLLEQDGRLVSYPSLLRVLPADAAIEIDRKRDRRLRPSFVAEHLRALRARPVRFRAEQFLESLYRAYQLALADRGKAPGSVVPLTGIYAIFTMLPGQSKEYSRPEFVRDVYLLDRSLVDRTRDGAVVSFPAATGTKGSGALVAVTQDGSTRAYYGVSFQR